MKTLLMKALFPLALLVALPLESARAQCVDNTHGFSSAATGVTNSGVFYAPTLTLPPGTYRYTYNTAGGIPIQNLESSLNATYWHPFLPIQVNNPTNNIQFSFKIPTPVPLCASSTIHVKYQRAGGGGFNSSWYTVCTFDLNVTIIESGPSENKKNLTFVKGISKAFYAGSDFKAHSLTWNPVSQKWDYAALNVIAPGWGTVQIDGQMASFDDGSRIFFRGKNKRLYNLIRLGGTNSNNWALAEVSAALPNVDGNVATRNNNEVVFKGTDNKLRRLTFTGGTFFINEIVVPVGGWGSLGTPLGDSINLPPATTNIFFAFGAGMLAHVYKVGNDWILEKISPPSAYNTPTAYYGYSELLAVENSVVYYKGVDRALHRYVKIGNNWNFDAMPISAASQNNVVIQHNGYLTKFPGEDRVFYKGASGSIYNIYKQNGVWYNYALNDGVTSTAGDLIAAEGKIFYINHDKRVHNFYWTGTKWWDVPLSQATPANTVGCLSLYYN